MTTTDTSATTSNRSIVGRHIPVLDGVRGVAILLVLVFHSVTLSGDSPTNTFLRPFVKPLWAGVDLFFVLSGLLITGILLDTKGGSGFFKKFYMRRLLRIFPLYYGVLILVFIAIPLLDQLLPIAPLDRLTSLDFYSTNSDRQIWLWTYFQNFLQARGEHQLPGFGHFWSLAIEEQFYMFWPFVVALLSSQRLKQLCILLVVSVLMLRIGLLLSGSTELAVRHYTFARIDSLAIGGLVACILRENDISAWYKRCKVGLLLSAMVLVAINFYTPGMPRKSFVVTTFGYSAWAIFFAAALFFIILEKTPIRLPAYLENQNLMKLGKYSYGLYVFHWPIANAVRFAFSYVGLSGDEWWNPMTEIAGFLITLLASLAISVASWKFYESKWLSLKRHYAYT